MKKFSVLFTFCLLFRCNDCVTSDVGSRDQGHSSDFKLMYLLLQDVYALQGGFNGLRNDVDRLLETEKDNEDAYVRKEEIIALRNDVDKLMKTEQEEGDKPLPGPTVNIATNYKSVSQSSESGSFRPASLAVDGNRNTFSHTANIQNQWWKMEFDQPVTIARVKIWNRPDSYADQLSGLKISVDGAICGYVIGPVALRAMTQVTSFKPLVGTVLTIQRAKAPLNLAEVQVFSSVGWRK